MLLPPFQCMFPWGYLGTTVQFGHLAKIVFLHWGGGGDRLMIHLLVHGPVGTGTVVVEVVAVGVGAVGAVGAVDDVGMVVTLLVPLFMCMLIL